MASTKFELLGRLCGYFCDECQTPLAGATLRLYGSAPGGNTGVSASACAGTVVMGGCNISMPASISQSFNG